MQQEVLLTLHSSFVHSQLNKTNEQENKNFSQEERLEEACSNGLIKELLPEVFKGRHKHRIYLWQMRPGFSFLQLELGELPSQVDKYSSINPHDFLSTYCYN